MSNVTPELAKQAQDGFQAILLRSATDLEFRARLLADPRAALSEFHGIEMPESLNVRFVENKAAATIVLPDVVNVSAELSEEELMAVAGGATPGAAVTATWVPSLNVVATVLSVVASVTYWINSAE